MSFDRWGDHRREQARELLALGRTCVKTGDKAQGRALLLQAVEHDRDLSDAWVWLSATTEDPAEQQQYLEWAVAAEPGNAQARRGLALLTGRINSQEILPPGEAPAPRLPSEPEPAQVRRTFACPQCGGRLRFDPASVDLRCAACGFVEVVAEELLADGARPLDFALPTGAGHRWAEGQRRFTCSQCGAAALLPPGGQSTVCPFCGNAALVAAPEDAGLLPVQGLLPMGLEAPAAQQAIKRWLGRGFFAPDNLARLVRDEGLRPAYVPFWIFEATLAVRWSADVQEGYGRDARWVRRTGEHTFFYRDQAQPASRALPARLLKQLPAFDLKKLIVFKPEYLADWPAALYDIALSDAALDAHAVMVQAAQSQLRTLAAPGRAVRNLEAAPNAFTGELYKLVLLPLWLGAYQYQHQLYRVLVNGQTGAVTGEKPRDNVKVALVVLGALLSLILIGLLVYWLAPR